MYLGFTHFLFCSLCSWSLIMITITASVLLSKHMRIYCTRDHVGVGVGVVVGLRCLYPRGPLIFNENIPIPDDKTLTET